MVRKTIVFFLAIGLAGFVASCAHAQTNVSPTQADLLNMVFSDFIDNEEPDMAMLDSVTPVGDDSVVIQFDTDLDLNDSDPDQGQFLYRVAMETTCDETLGCGFNQDFTGVDTFDITFSNPVINPPEISGITAQIFVRSAGAFAASGGFGIPNSGSVTASLPTSTIVANGGDITAIDGFGIEFFGGDEFAGGLVDAQVTASTTPQPPTLVDTLISSFETGFEGWDSEPITPDAHVQEVLVGSPGNPAFGATDGLNSLKITRNFTAPDAGNTFVWGSRKALDANANTGGPPNGDYNNNNTVDAADYGVWLAALGQTDALPNDAIGGQIGQAQYDQWKENFGATGGGPDPDVLAEIQELADLINDPNAYSISFDLTIQDQFEETPGNATPGFAIIHLAVAVDDQDPNADDPFFQFDQINLPIGDVASGPITLTLDMPIASFIDTNGSGSLADVGIADGAQYFQFNLASNFEVVPNDVVFYIDNFRIRTIVPEAGVGSTAGVPEPTTLALLALGLVSAAATRLRHD